jgi:hypothetical protein
MTKQPEGDEQRHGIRRGQRAITDNMTPEFARDVYELLGAVLQALFDHQIINRRDVANVARNPSHSSSSAPPPPRRPV